ncbi:MAG TPA: helix-turn-helix domain-containing protein [Acidimicrobiales bacterium]|nr:helix-turn-helix domain-containing protein [Acidimicrobiales bacterium]
MTVARSDGTKTQQQVSVANNDDSASPSLDSLAAAFRDLGLSGYEASILVALVQLGSATATQLAKVSGITRPNVYPALEALRAKGAVEVAMGKVNQWVCPPRDEVVERLRRAEEERLRAAEARVGTRAEEAKGILSTLAPAAPEPALPYARLIGKAAEASALYHRSVSEATSEILVTNQGPYAGRQAVQPEVLDAIARGVKIRALYRAVEIDKPYTDDFIATIGAYSKAGVEGRIVEDVGVPVAIFDRRLVLAALDDPVDPGGRFPTTVVADHTGLAFYAVAAFEQLWASGVPYAVTSAAAGGAAIR